MAGALTWSPKNFTKVGKVNYDIKIKDRRKRKRIFHINMLRKWRTPTAASLFADEAESQTPEDDNDDLVTWKDEDGYGIPS